MSPRFSPIPWTTVEAEVARRLRPKLRTHLRTAHSAHAVVRAAILMVSAAPPGAGLKARTVQTRLLVRLSNDLRLVEVAGLRGYILQAMTLGATIYELTHAMGFIGTDEERARRWENHDTMEQSFPSTRDRKAAVRATLRALGFEDAKLEEEFAQQERKYQIFCAAKHGNPLFQRDWGRISEALISHGPFIETRTPQQVMQVLYTTSRLLWFATGVYVFPWYEAAPNRERERFRRHLRRFEELLWQAKFASRGTKPPPRAV